jgi:hypothetical protein
VHLASDHIHPYRSDGGRRARCRVRIHLPDHVRDAPAVICSELLNNYSGSIIDSAEVLAAGSPAGGDGRSTRRREPEGCRRVVQALRLHRLSSLVMKTALVKALRCDVEELR